VRIARDPDGVLEWLAGDRVLLMRVMSDSRPGRCLLLVPLFALVFGGCHAAVQPDLPVVLAVDSAAYHRLGQSPVAVPFAVTNDGPTPIHVAQCDGRPVAVVDGWGVGGWRFLDGGFCNGGTPAPLELAAGASAHGVVILYEGGAYRLRVNWVSEAPGSREASGSSKSFEVW
jgi:hypothetical protein